MKLVLNMVKDEIFIVHLITNVNEGSDSVTVFCCVYMTIHTWLLLLLAFFFCFCFFTFEGTYCVWLFLHTVKILKFIK